MEKTPSYMDYSPRYNLRQNIKLRRCREADAFSRLPDELIISQILSRLMPGTAARCSLVSRRWRCLWKQSYSCRLLLFISLWDESYTCLWNMEEVGCKFVKSVNDFLDLIKQKPTIHEFIVRFDLGIGFSTHINNWLSFALTRSVEQIELDLTPNFERLNKLQYVFPGIDKLPDFNASHCVGLRNIRFKNVDVDGEAIQHMISNCCSLERVSVKNSNSLRYLNVCGGESVAGGLKHLKIVGCKYAVKFNISSPSLVSFKYRGSWSALCLGDVPCLSELSIGGSYCRAFLSQAISNHECLSRLKKLQLVMTRKAVKDCINYPLDFENFVSLEELEVKMTIYNGLFLLWPTVLIKAAPALRRFAVKLNYAADEVKLLNLQLKLEDKFARREDLDTIVVGRTLGMTRKIQRKIKRASKQHQNECLKVIEIHNFVGHESDLKLIRHLLRMKFSSLEKLVLVTSCNAPINYKGSLWGKQYEERQQKHSRGRAIIVRKWLSSSSSTELVIR